MKADRIGTMTGLALREVAHLKTGWIVALLGLAMLAGESVLRDFNFGVDEARFLQDIAGGVVLLFGTALAILLTVTLVQGNLERGLPAVLFARGVGRTEWLLATMSAVCVALAALVVVAHAGLAVLLHRQGDVVPALAQAQACGRNLVRVGLIAAFALAGCVVTRNTLLAAVLALALTLAAQLAPVIAWAAQHGGTAARPFWAAIDLVLPNFASVAAGAGPAAFFRALGQGILIVAASCQVFSHREL